MNDFRKENHGYIRSKLLLAGNSNAPDGSNITSLITNNGPQGPFSPTNLVGLQIWLDASDASSMTLSGSSILDWKNKAAGGNTPYTVQVASPTYVTAFQNGLNVVNFSNASSVQAMSDGGTSKIFTSTVGFVAGFVIEATSGNENLPLFFSINNELGTQITGFALSGNAGFGNIFLGFLNQTNCGFSAVTPNGFVTDIVGKFNTFIFTYDGSGFNTSNPGGFKIYFNGNSLALSLAGNVGSQTGNNAIGSWGVNGNRLDGYFAEAIIANQPVSAGVVGSLQAYMKAKWGTP